MTNDDTENNTVKYLFEVKGQLFLYYGCYNGVG